MRRRAVLRAGAAVLVGVGTAGCLGSGGPAAGGATPEPVDLGGGKLDDQGGMEIGRHGGPNGQIFWRSNTPEGRGNPAWFHTLAFGLFPYYFEHRAMGWRAEVIYATDYSIVDYELAGGERPTISSPTAADTFGNARELRYVMESDVRGGMGPDFVPFSDPADADAFVGDHGGRIVGFDDVTPELVDGYTR